MARSPDFCSLFQENYRPYSGKEKCFNSNFVISVMGVVWMCSVGGALNLDIEELTWIKYQCNNCGKVYKSTGKKSVCPGCKSDNVVPI
jgi:Zn finger protein HypA/HybF involved in hydrogenase expression